MSRGRFGAGIAFALIAGATLVAAMPGVARAHAAYKDSNPADESTVSEPPGEIWAEYTEPPTDASYLKVYDPCGEQVDNGDSRPEGYRVYVTTSAARAGDYRVTWFVDSAVDAHSTRGQFTFTVTDGEPCPGAEPEEETVVRGGRERNSGAGPGGGSGAGSTGASAGGTDGGGSAAGSMSGDGRRQHRQHRDDAAQGGDRSRGRDDVVAAPGTESGTETPREPGLFEDIPIGGLVLGLGMAVLIGAAGGFIYAGIMGYTRTGT